MILENVFEAVQQMICFVDQTSKKKHKNKFIIKTKIKTHIIK